MTDSTINSTDDIFPITKTEADELHALGWCSGFGWDYDFDWYMDYCGAGYKSKWVTEDEKWMRTFLRDLKSIRQEADAKARRERLGTCGEELLEALEHIASLSASGPHPSPQDGMTSALSALDRARDIANAAIRKAKGDKP